MRLSMYVYVILYTCTVYLRFTFLLLSFPSTLIIIMKDTNTQLLMLKLQTTAIILKDFVLLQFREQHFVVVVVVVVVVGDLDMTQS